MSGFSNLLATWFRGEHVGTDEFGNRYYRDRKPRSYRATAQRERRWVRYQGHADGSKTPPLWNAWLNHTMDNPPCADDFANAPAWLKPHQENMSGTAMAYRPKGSLVTGTSRDPVAGDYEPWTPS